MAVTAKGPTSANSFTRRRTVIHVDSAAARCIGGLALLGVTCWMIGVLSGQNGQAQWQPAGRLAWSLTVLAAVALIARGIFLSRPVTAVHATFAIFAVFAGLGAHVLSFDLVGDVLIAGSGLALMWPTSARPRAADSPRIWALINATSGDPLAPFAMQSGKRYHFTADGTAALAYCTRIGYAVVSGDPIGAEARFPELVADFAGLCHTRGWRLVVLSCSERRLGLWSDPALPGQSLRAIPIGRDVVIDVSRFELVGRKFRNLRQAVKRTHNCGITTEVVSEHELDHGLLVELVDVVRAARSGAHADRGFSMNLDGVLEGRYPGVQLIVGRDSSGRVQGFQRYGIAGGGTDISLDVPWRRAGAPNGLDERLSVDMIYAVKEAGAQRVSLAFAAFPEIFDAQHRSRLQTVFYFLIHLLNPLIELESLYRYLRKFRALGDQRYVMVNLTQLIPLLYVLFTLEFMPRRRRL